MRYNAKRLKPKQKHQLDPIYINLKEEIRQATLIIVQTDFQFLKEYSYFRSNALQLQS